MNTFKTFQTYLNVIQQRHGRWSDRRHMMTTQSASRDEKINYMRNLCQWGSCPHCRAYWRHRIEPLSVVAAPQLVDVWRWRSSLWHLIRDDACAIVTRRHPLAAGCQRSSTACPRPRHVAQFYVCAASVQSI